MDGEKDHDYYAIPKFPVQEQLVGAQEAVNAFLDMSHSFGQQRILLLLGLPGQGKTSFCRELIHRKLRELPDQDLHKAKIFHLRLRDISDVDAFFRDPLRGIEEHLSRLVLRRRDGIELRDIEDSLLILDGLDELAMREGIGEEDIELLYRKLYQELEHLPQMRILISSRHAQAYLNKVNPKDILVLELQRFSLDEQLQWLQNYKSKHETCSFDEEFFRKEVYDSNKVWTHEEYMHHEQIDEAKKIINELLDQPLLLYLVAHANLGLNKSMLTKKKFNRAYVYKLLFDSLVNRSWDKYGQIQALKGLNMSALRQFLREVAYFMTVHQRVYIKQSELQELEHAKLFLQSLGKENSNELFRLLMLAFYMRSSDNEEAQADDDYAIEFLHKTLQEYLAAEYAWEQIKSLLKKNKKGKYQVKTGKKAKEFILSHFSSLPIHTDKFRADLQECISLEGKSPFLKPLFKGIIQLVDEVLPSFHFPNEEYSFPQAGIYTFFHFMKTYIFLASQLNRYEPMDWIPQNQTSRSLFAMAFREAESNRMGFLLKDGCFENCNLSGLSLIGINNTTYYDNTNKKGSYFTKIGCYDFGNLVGADFSGMRIESSAGTIAPHDDSDHWVVFIQCNFSSAQIENCNFKYVLFADIKSWVDCLVFSSILNIHIQAKNSLKGIKLKHTQLCIYESAYKRIHKESKEEENSEQVYSAMDIRESRLHIKDFDFDSNVPNGIEPFNYDWEESSEPKALIFTDTSFSMSELCIERELCEIVFQNCSFYELKLRSAFLHKKNPTAAYYHFKSLRIVQQNIESSSYESNIELDMQGIAIQEAIDLSSLMLNFSKLSYTVLEYANFQSASLAAVCFEGAVLRGANFQGAIIAGANFAGADLRGVDFTGALMLKRHVKGTYPVFILNDSRISDTYVQFAEIDSRIEDEGYNVENLEVSENNYYPGFSWSDNPLRANFKGAIFDEHTRISKEQLAQADGVDEIIYLKTGEA